MTPYNADDFSTDGSSHEEHFYYASQNSPILLTLIKKLEDYHKIWNQKIIHYSF